MIVFQHLAKTAGTTVYTVLNAALGSRILLLPRDGELLNCEKAAFEERDVVAGHFSTRAIAARFESAEVVTCLREPVDRIVSHYFYWRNVLGAEALARGLDGRMRRYTDPEADPWDNLLACLSSDAVEAYSELRDYQTWMLGFSCYHRSGLDETEVLKRAKAHLDQALFVADQNNLGALLTWASQHFKFALDLKDFAHQRHWLAAFCRGYAALDSESYHGEKPARSRAL